jgi:hypothetical protein
LRGSREPGGCEKRGKQVVSRGMGKTKSRAHTSVRACKAWTRKIAVYATQGKEVGQKDQGRQSKKDENTACGEGGSKWQGERVGG